MKITKQLNTGEAMKYIHHFAADSKIFLLVHNDEESRKAQLNAFKEARAHTYYIMSEKGKAKDKMGRCKEVLRAILHVLGQPEPKGTASAYYRCLLNALSGEYAPILILDNADVLDTYAIGLLYQLYNDRRATVVLAGTNHFMERIQKRAEKRKDLYAGFESRIMAYLIID